MVLLGSGLIRAWEFEVALDEPMFKGSVQEGRGVAATLPGGLLWGDRSQERPELSVWMGGQRRLGIDGIGSAFLVVGL